MTLTTEIRAGDTRPERHFPAPCTCVVEGGAATVRCSEAEGLWEGILSARQEVLGRSGRSKGHEARVEAFHERREAYYRHLGRVS